MNAPATLESGPPLEPIAPRALVPVGRIDLNTMGFEEMQRVGKVLVECGYYRDIRNVAQVVAKLMVGQELGLSTFEAMTGLDFIEGKLEMKPALMAARINRSKEYRYVLERNDKDGEKIDDPRCVIAFYRKPDELLGRQTWAHSDHVRAGLAGKDVYKKYPDAMRFARCMSAGTRKFCGDIIGGGTIYVEGEIEPFNVTPVAQSNVTPIASAPSAQAVVIDVEDPVAAGKMRRITEIAGELMVTAARMNLDVEKCDGDLDKLLAMYEQKKSARKPARGATTPTTTPTTPAVIPSTASVGGVSSEVPVVTPQPAVGGEPAAPLPRTLPGKVARAFIGTPFAATVDRHAFAAHHLALEGDVASFKDLTDEQLETVEAKLHQTMREIREANDEAARAEAAGKVKLVEEATKAAPTETWCPACGVPPGKAHFAGCEMVA